MACLRNGIIMLNVKYGKWHKEIIIIKLKSKRASLLFYFLVPTWVSNCFAGPFITAGSNQQGRTESSDKLYILDSCLCSTYLILKKLFIFGVFDNTFFLSAHHYNIVKCQNARGKRTLFECEFRLATIPRIDHIWARLNEHPKSNISNLKSRI